MLLVLVCYGLRLAELPVRGEESRWGQVAREMIFWGDWVVSRQQGEPFLSRPPVHSWTIALAILGRGQLDVWALRLPSLVATLLTVFLVYAYARAFLKGFGAFAAALAFATMAEVLQAGYQAETERFFILLLAGSLLVWHYGYARGWPSAWTWSAGYALAALAALTKGPQAPVYFVATTSLFLLFQGQYRLLFCRAQLLGIAVFVLIVAAWQVPFYLELDADSVVRIWTGDAAMRFRDQKLHKALLHVVRYPAEVLGCTLPWSLLLLAYLSRSFRRALGAYGSLPAFLGVCLLVAFPTCWLTPGGRTRYFMPLYPCLAVLIGVVIERAQQAAPASKLTSGWQRFLQTAGLALVGIVVLVNAGTSGATHPVLKTWAQPLGFAFIYSLSGCVLGALLFVCARHHGPRAVPAAVLALAIGMGLTHVGVFTNCRLNKSETVAEQVLELREQLPAGRPLVSLGPVHHLFAYHYGQPIELRPWPTDADRLADHECFCFDSRDTFRPALPFAWEELAVIPLDRNRHATPKQVVVVGRRLPSPRQQ